MNKKALTLILMLAAQASVLAQDIVYSQESNSCCPTSSVSCCPRSYSTRCCPERACGGRRWTGGQRWRNCCGPEVRRCRPKRTCCPRLRCCRPRPACCPPVAPACDAAPCLKGNGSAVYDQNGSFVEEAGIPEAAPVTSAATAPVEAAEDLGAKESLDLP